MVVMMFRSRSILMLRLIMNIMMVVNGGGDVEK